MNVRQILWENKTSGFFMKLFFVGEKKNTGFFMKLFFVGEKKRP